MMRSYFIGTLTLISLFSCTSMERPELPEEIMAERLMMLKSWMSGDFNSSALAASDTNYYSIDLHMCLIREDSGKWFELYVEQALSSRPESPYRQRIYHITAVDTLNFVSEIYVLNEDSLFVGACASDELKAQLPLAGQYKKEGCDVHLKWNGIDGFEGATLGTDCYNVFGGAAYATSEVTVKKDRIESLDQGYDQNGVKVWGPSGKAYVFLRE